ncbi:MAG: DHH family phosphoesterase [Candidatus Moranbacteria bacterium]|nr:DHH family phosphoesterase [Candidatus Moranbacteria bacterium]
MTLEPFAQLKKLLDESKEILILIPEGPTGDAVGAAWALYFWLEKKGVLPTIAFSNNFPDKFSFLPKPERLLNEISGARDFILSFNTQNNPITNVRTEIKDSAYNIYITPEKGAIDPRDFSFVPAKFKYDLIIVIDSPDLERLGKIYEKNSDLFFEVPVVNIDYRSDNERYGQVAIVDVLASSSSEVVANLLERLNGVAIDEKIAECLLAGITSATDSFQKKNTTPRALLLAAALMGQGADQQKIVRFLYKTQTLNILKLWGRAMANLKWDAESQIVWTEINIEDFVQSRTRPNDIPLILDKLQENYSEGSVFAVLYQNTAESVIAMLKPTNGELLRKLQSALGGIIKREMLEITLGSGDLATAGKTLVEKIKGAQKA